MSKLRMHILLWNLWRREYDIYSWWFKLQVLLGKRCSTFDEYKEIVNQKAEYFRKHSKELIEKTSCTEAQMIDTLTDLVKALNDE